MVFKLLSELDLQKHLQEGIKLLGLVHESQLKNLEEEMEELRKRVEKLEFPISAPTQKEAPATLEDGAEGNAKPTTKKSRLARNPLT